MAGAAWTELRRRIVCRCKGEGAAAGSTRRDFRLLIFAKARICFYDAELCATRGQGRTLAFVEVPTAREDQAALPEQTVTAEKQHLVGRTEVSDGATRERVPAVVRCGGNRRVSRSAASGYGCIRTRSARGCSHHHWKIHRRLAERGNMKVRGARRDTSSKPF